MSARGSQRIFSDNDRSMINTDRGVLCSLDGRDVKPALMTVSTDFFPRHQGNAGKPIAGSTCRRELSKQLLAFGARNDLRNRRLI